MRAGILPLHTEIGQYAVLEEEICPVCDQGELKNIILCLTCWKLFTDGL